MHRIWTSIEFIKKIETACNQVAFRLFKNGHRDIDLILRFSDEYTFGAQFSNVQNLYSIFNVAHPDNILYNVNIYLYGSSDTARLVVDNINSSFIRHEFNIDELDDCFKDHDNFTDMDQVDSHDSGLDSPVMISYNQHYASYKINMYEVCGVGGTFNLLHNGHKLLLSLAALLSDKQLYIGISDRELLLKKSQPQLIETLETRIYAVDQFLGRFKKGLVFNYIALKHPLETWDFDYVSLVVSEETLKAVDVFNDLRKDAGLGQLRHATLKLVESSEENAKFSSSQLRQLINNKVSGKDDLLALKNCFLNSINYLTHHHIPINQHEESTPLAQYRTKDSIPLFDLTTIGTAHKAEYIFYQLCLKYSESNRYYHTLSHIADCIQKLERDFKSILSKEDYFLAAVAIFFHDIIYDAKAKINEEQSALYFEGTMGLIELPDNHIEIVMSIIRHTENHDLPEKHDKIDLFKAVMDIDLSILADSIDKYELYAKNIRNEYGFIPWDVYKIERAKVLRYLASKSPIYHFEIYKEADVRRNVDYEIENLLNGDDIKA